MKRGTIISQKYSFPFYHAAITYNLTHIILLFSFPFGGLIWILLDSWQILLLHNPWYSVFSPLIATVQSSQKVYWSEPTFQDNVKIEQIEASALPGGDLSLGKHVIVYQVSREEEETLIEWTDPQAKDGAGNSEKCVFAITIVQFQQENAGKKWLIN